MLTKLDDTLWHQLPTTFDHVGTSDPRFFDRYWFAVYDPAVHLSQLLGANRRYIETHLPHIGKLLRAEIGDVIKESEVLVVGLSGPEIIKDLEQFCQPGQVVLDLVRIADGSAIRAEVQGLCW